MYRFENRKCKNFFEVDDEINIWTFGGSKNKVTTLNQKNSLKAAQFQSTTYPNILNFNFKLANAVQLRYTFATAILTVTAMLDAIV